MATIKLPFNNNTTRPNVSIVSSTDSLSGNASDTEKDLMLVGSADGGVPGEVYEFNSYAQAKTALRGGDLLSAIELAFNPTDDGISASTIYAVRVGNAKQASFVSNGLTVTSQQYMDDANKIQVLLRTNSLTSSYDFQVAFQNDNYNATYSNLGNLFSLTYDGSLAYASVTVSKDATSGKATNLTLKAGADEGSAVLAGSFDLGAGKYTTVGSLLSDINQIAGFHATYAVGISKSAVQTAYIDALAETALSSTAVTVTSLGGDLLNVVGQRDSQISIAYDPSKGEPEVFPLTFLSGGTDGDVPTSWSDEISSLQTSPGYYLVPLSDDSAIHAEAVAFANDRTRNGNPTRVIIGGGTNETITQAVTRRAQLKDSRALLVASSGSRLMNNGTTQSLPAYMIAVMVAGIASGIDVGAAVFNHYLDLVDVDQKFTSDELDLLDEQGVVAVEYVRNRSAYVFRVTDDVTTYGYNQNDSSSDPVLGLQSAGEAADYFSVGLREMFESTFLGQRISTGAAAELKTATIAYLTTEQSLGIIEDFDESDISVTVQGANAIIQVDIVPTLVMRKIQVNVNYQYETLTA